MTIHDLRKTLWKHKGNGNLYRVVAVAKKEVMLHASPVSGEGTYDWETWVQYVRADDFAEAEVYQRTLVRFLKRFDAHDKFPERKDKGHEQEVSEGIPT